MHNFDVNINYCPFNVSGTIRADNGTSVPVVLHGVRLSALLHDLDWPSRGPLPRSLLRLLQVQVRHGQDERQKGRQPNERQGEQQRRRLHARARRYDAKAKRRLVVRDHLQEQGVQQLLQQRHKQRLRGEQQHGEEDCLEVPESGPQGTTQNQRCT